MKIRIATLDDIPHLRDLAQQSAEAPHWSEQRYRAIFDSAPRRVAILIEADAIAGFIVAGAFASEWEIENIVIAENVRRQGLGRLLLLDLLDRARREKARSVFLEVRDSNSAAKRLYESVGFAQIGRRPRYYSHPDEDAILYRFEIA